MKYKCKIHYNHKGGGSTVSAAFYDLYSLVLGYYDNNNKISFKQNDKLLYYKTINYNKLVLYNAIVETAKLPDELCNIIVDYIL